MLFDVTLASQPSWKLKSTFFNLLQNSFFKLKFPSFRRTSSKYSMKQKTRGQLRFEQTSKIWCRNIHAFLRNCGFRVGAFYFDAPCSYKVETNLLCRWVEPCWTLVVIYEWRWMNRVSDTVSTSPAVHYLISTASLRSYFTSAASAALAQSTPSPASRTQLRYLHLFNFLK